MLESHPTFTQAPLLADICKPLEHLNINCFGHVHINNELEMTYLRNQPIFTEIYHSKNYHLADIHSAQGHFGEFILWSSLSCSGKTDSMVKDAADAGYHQFFSIIEKNRTGTNFYHFATGNAFIDMSQTYLSNIDALKKFTRYFHEKIAQSKELSVWDQIKFKIDHHHDDIHFGTANRNQFLRDISDLDYPTLTLQQKKCIGLLLQGYSPKQIAAEMNLTYKTVEHYLATIRAKFQCKTTRELILKIR